MDAGSKSLKRSETKSALLKRKSTVSNVLQSLHVVPSFSEAFSGDILPEAVLLKNILEEMIYQIFVFWQCLPLLILNYVEESTIHIFIRLVFRIQFV